MNSNTFFFFFFPNNLHQCVLCVLRINKCVCPKLMRHSDKFLIVLRQQWSSLAQGIKIPGFDYTLVHCCFCAFYGICGWQKTTRIDYHQTSAEHSTSVADLTSSLVAHWGANTCSKVPKSGRLKPENRGCYSSILRSMGLEQMEHLQ